jgi:hypothetical protein
MLVLVRAQATSSVEVTWVSEYPTRPLTDYFTFGSLPDVSNIGTVSLFPLSAEDMDEMWSATRANAVTTIYPLLGADLIGRQWSRKVDNETDVLLTLTGDNLSPSWARISDTDIAPRRQL